MSVALDLVWLIPALPLAGFLVLLLAGRRLGEPGAGWVATLASGGSFVARGAETVRSSGTRWCGSSSLAVVGRPRRRP